MVVISSSSTIALEHILCAECDSSQALMPVQERKLMQLWRLPGQLRRCTKRAPPRRHADAARRRHSRREPDKARLTLSSIIATVPSQFMSCGNSRMPMMRSTTQGPRGPNSCSQPSRLPCRNIGCMGRQKRPKGGADLDLIGPLLAIRR